MKKVKSIFVLVFVVLIISQFSLISFASVETEGGNHSIEQQVDETVENKNKETEPQNSTENGKSLDEINELETVVEINKELRAIYGVWTTVITIVLVLVTILGIAIPLYDRKNINKKIQEEIKKMQEETKNLNQRQLTLNNALMLSASKDYCISNTLLEKLLQEDKQDAYIHLLIGRNTFLQYESEELDRELTDDDRVEIEKAIEHFIFVVNNLNNESNFYELGSVFPDSVIHELCMLTTELIYSSINDEMVSNYHKLTVRVIKTIEQILKIESFDDIANEDQTNVHIMNYKKLNHVLAESYKTFGNIKAINQYKYTLSLYKISSELNEAEAIEDCVKNIEDLSFTL